jgi:Ca-activated chloride channel family protein
LQAAGDDTRFSIAVAAFGQKLRDTDQVAGYSWDAIRDLAAGARGDDPYGERGEFLRLVGLAKSLDR